jgi:hypothetical protein
VIKSDRAGPGRAKGFSLQCAGQGVTENPPHPSPTRWSVHMLYYQYLLTTVPKMLLVCLSLLNLVNQIADSIPAVITRQWR